MGATRSSERGVSTACETHGAALLLPLLLLLPPLQISCRYAGRTVVTSAVVAGALVGSLDYSGLADVHWQLMWSKGREWVERNAQCTGMWQAVRRRWERLGEGDGEEQGRQREGERDLESDVDRVMKAVEVVVVRVLSTVSGVGFAVGALYRTLAAVTRLALRPIHHR